MMYKNEIKSIKEKVEIANEVQEKSIKRESINTVLSGFMISAGIITIVITKVF